MKLLQKFWPASSVIDAGGLDSHETSNSYLQKSFYIFPYKFCRTFYGENFEKLASMQKYTKFTF
jgi:hypothetical protein